MTIKNVTKRAAYAMYSLSQTEEKFSHLLYAVKGEENKKLLMDLYNDIDVAQKELVKILAQDNRVEELT